MSCLYLRSKPGYKLGVANVKLFFADEVSHFEATLFAILFRDHDPAVVVVFVLSNQLFDGRGIDCKFCADTISPEVFDEFYGCRPEDCGVKACDENITLSLSQ